MATLNSTELLTAADRIEIHELATAYGFHHDRRDFDSLRACFTADATYIMRIADGATHGPRLGADAIVEQIQTFKRAQNDKRRHHISNIQVTPQDANTATVHCYVIVSAVAHGELSFKTVGTYTDTVTRTEDGWRISAKQLDLDTGF
jgi:3-phenylpropionate/cinnamic acid dioxygenase small subunit